MFYPFCTPYLPIVFTAWSHPLSPSLVQLVTSGSVAEFIMNHLKKKKRLTWIKNDYVGLDIFVYTVYRFI